MSNTINASFINSLVLSARKGSNRSFNELCRLMEPALKKLVKQYAFANFEEDFEQEALVGLWNAVKSFDETKSSFMTYAKNCMRFALLDYVKKGQNIIGVKADVTENIRKIQKAEEAFQKEGILMPTHEELFEASGVRTMAAFEDALLARTSISYTSLDQEVGDEEDSDSLLNLLAASGSVDDELLNEEREEMLKTVISSLSEQERLVYLHDNGLFGHQKLTNGGIMKVVGLSEPTVIVRRKKAEGIVKDFMEKYEYAA